MAEEIENTAIADIPKILSSQKTFFEAGNTLELPKRLEKLKKLKDVIEEREAEICEALCKDFQKPEFETVVTETSFIISELKFIIKNLKQWMKPKKVKSSWLNFPSSDFIYSNPYGNVLILAPWNYPFQLKVSPAIGAIAAGNTVVLKPSEYSPYTAKIVEEIFSEVFEPEWVSVVQGEVAASKKLLEQKWDYVFFTGSVPVGREVAKAIAPNLTPATLELGGKSPCIIHKSAKIGLAAKRIVWGKFINAGQTCIAPDYVMIDSSVKEEFYTAVKKEIKSAFGESPQLSPDFARIVNEKNFDRLEYLLKDQNCVAGGETDADSLYISPTVIDEPSLESEVMQDEIFGPILPVISYSSRAEMNKVIVNFPKPLALYVFSEDKDFSENIIKNYNFGGGAVNDVLVHIANKKLPFGGVGDSGYGAYHGKFSFDTFTHKKSISKRGTWIDIPLRYAPYEGKLTLVKKVIKRL
ncbi:aldehyde dehydrogenase [Salinimicrobium sp. TH3]|uniref:aldehyde dehydrogenase n=1 Tax=Salinimicrobium sp. TH3 TaxID=2997342 RepID=UPI0022736600|nr:aldehyde dehydrogenase [Salinimicrobium sp. TH3]MCY2686883.1 aldehyde dehydrogenase [Salinimicrobium sp. TH3]